MITQRSSGRGCSRARPSLQPAPWAWFTSCRLLPAPHFPLGLARHPWAPGPHAGPKDKSALQNCSAESSPRMDTPPFSEAIPTSSLPPEVQPGGTSTWGQAEDKHVGSQSMAPVVTGSLLPWQVPLHAVWQPHGPAVPGQCTLRSPAAAPVSGYDGSPPRRPSVGKKGWGAEGYGHPPHSADWELGGITRGLLEPQDRQFGTLVRINSGTPCEWAGGTGGEECPFWT